MKFPRIKPKSRPKNKQQTVRSAGRIIKNRQKSMQQQLDEALGVVRKDKLNKQ